MSTDESTPVLEGERTFCAVHPDRESSLQCNKCGRYMCVDCAVPTPVGYRCRECVRGIENRFFNDNPADGVIVFLIIAVLAGIGAFVALQVRFLLLVLIAAMPVGGFIAEVALRVIRRRRGRHIPRFAAAGAALGGLAPLLYILLVTGRFVPNLTLLLYAGVVTFAVYGRFRMRG